VLLVPMMHCSDRRCQITNRGVARLIRRSGSHMESSKKSANSVEKFTILGKEVKIGDHYLKVLQLLGEPWFQVKTMESV